MSTRGALARRKPGRPATHNGRGALAEFRRGRPLNYSRTHVKQRALYIVTFAVRLVGREHWDAVEAALLDRSQPKVSRLKRAESVALAPLDAAQRERVTAAASVGAAYKEIESYVFRQRRFIGADGELIPCMRKSLLAFSRDWRRELATFDLEPEDIERGLPVPQHIVTRPQNGSHHDTTAPQSADRSPGQATASPSSRNGSSDAPTTPGRAPAPQSEPPRAAAPSPSQEPAP